MIDNYDSFTFNLVHYFESLGQVVEVYRNDQISVAQIAQKSPQYLVISPGPQAPEQAGLSLSIIKEFSGKIPILGVCLGHQCIGEHFGGTVAKADKVMHGKTSMIAHDSTGLFYQLNQPLTVTRYHSLEIVPDSLPNALKVNAWINDEFGQLKHIMAIEHKTLPIVGVQFHPESVMTEQGHQLLQNFLNKYASDKS